MTDGWLDRPHGTEPAARPGMCAQGTRVPDHRLQKHTVIIRSHGEDRRRSVGEQQPGGSGPSSGKPTPRLHLAMIPPGTRGMPHYHADRETAVYVVSGEADVWHGPGLVQRSAVRAGDFIYIPPGTPHLTVNGGDVTSIAVAAHTDPAEQPVTIVIELPRHLVGLSSYPVG